MIAIISTDEIFRALAEMNQYGRYQLYRVKASDPEGIHTELARLSSYSHLIYDVASLPAEQGSELLLPLCTGKCKIIVIATDLSPYDLVVRDFYSMGITDVITESGTAMQKEINDILLQSKAHAAAASSNEPIEPTPEPKDVPPLHSADSLEVQSIAFAGAGARIGTTTQVFQTALYLISLFHKAAVVDLSAQTWIHNCSDDPDIKKLGENHYSVYGIPYYDNNRSIPKLRSQYDYLIFDYGRFDQIADIGAFVEKDVHIVVCGYKPRECLALIPVFASEISTLRYLFTHVPDYTQKTVQASMKNCASNTYFAGYTPDMWHYCGNDNFYQTITGVVIPAAKKRTIRNKLTRLIKISQQ